MIEVSEADVVSTYAQGELEGPGGVHARQASRATVQRKVSFIDEFGLAEPSLRRKRGRPRLAAQNGAVCRELNRDHHGAPVESRNSPRCDS